MKILTPPPFSLLYSVAPGLPWVGDLQGKSVLCLGLLAGFRLGSASDGPLDALVPEEELWETVESTIPEGDVLDAGLPKPCSEFLVYAAACSPAPVPVLECSVQVGEAVKRLKVFGDRVLSPDKAGEPAPFTRMEISWARAFGGEGHEYNPQGKGFDPLKDVPRPRPNVLAWDLPDPFDMQQTPAGLMAMPVTWPQRQGLLGATDAAWLKTNWPGLPRDTDPKFACAAPADQRLPGFLAGGEDVAIHNMHPQSPILRGSVPRLRGRLFIQRADSRGGAFLELPCAMETLWLFPERMLGVLLFRGVVPVQDEECEDVAAVLALAEDASREPIPVEEYRCQCREALHPGPDSQPDAQPDALTDTGQTPAESVPSVQDEAALLGVGLAGAGVGAGVAAAARSPLQETVDSLEQQIRDLLQELRLDQEQVEEWLAEQTRKSPLSGAADQGPQPGPEPGSGEANPLAALANLVESIQEETRSLQERYGLSDAELHNWMDEQQAAAMADTGDHLATLRKMAEAPDLAPEVRLELEKALVAFTAAGAAVASLAGLSTLGRKAEPGADEAQDEPRLDFPEHVDAPPAPDEPLSTEQALERLRKTGSLAHCDLTQCDFSGQNLSGADLRGCLMSGVAWKDVDLSGANLSQAVAHDAVLEGVRLDGATLDEADFEKASLSGGSARNCSAVKTSFQEACLDRLDLSQARASDADCRGASMRGLNGNGLTAPGLRLQEANLERAVFQDADLAGSRADSQTRASGADFSRADCTDACWSGASLTGARLEQARLDQADLAKADLSRANLFLASLKQAVLDKARLQEAELTGCNLFEASLRRADCSGATIQDANLFAADLHECRIARDLPRDVNVGRTVLDRNNAEADHD
ncbi:DUF2169 domain-containing protein [Desulfonatronum sp. SC1]|uniref:DUF2169 family type VI secretion system accessory protein n=1 Tax=Desulfonatronum sp. SC1 TaxID=2109626 RepID=UPI000D30F1FC|nr:DUF2169 domain-containing protein [Desulfonatronum sp. SC1]PTN36014.1 hypothetical protein C6366_10745 [Desulfonatronum sp. SC1]